MKVTPLKKKFGAHAIGTVFDMPDKSARVFLKLGRLARADVAPVEVAALAPQEAVHDVVAPEPEVAEVAEAEAAPVAPRTRRTYQRRDMTAEPRAVTKKVTKRATKKATTRNTKD